jgi:hypothetical protein
MRKFMTMTTRGRERATAREDSDQLVRQTVNGRSELLPSDPKATALILAGRRAKTPAAKVRAKIAADLRRRGHG